MTFTHNISPELINFGPFTIRWYGLLFVTGFMLSALVAYWLFKREQKDLRHLESIALYLLIGMIVGARLGHIIFYNLDYYLKNPAEIIMIWHGGLASHGAAIGLLIAYLIWIKIYKVKFAEYIDLLVIGMPLTAACVRLGNFFNSEIIGQPTDGSWGVIFVRLSEEFPRHPTQLYESGLSLLIFAILFITYRKYYQKLPRLFIMFLYIFLYFSTRFVVEFWKERHVISNDFPLSMGQMLSILPILISIVIIIFIFNKHKVKKEKV